MPPGPDAPLLAAMALCGRCRAPPTAARHARRQRVPHRRVHAPVPLYRVARIVAGIVVDSVAPHPLCARA